MPFYYLRLDADLAYINNDIIYFSTSIVCMTKYEALLDVGSTSHLTCDIH